MIQDIYKNITDEIAHNPRSGNTKPVAELSLNSNYMVWFSCPLCSEVRRVYYSKIARKTFTGLCLKCLKVDHRKTLSPGAKYGRLTVIDSAGINKSLVECECGVRQEVINWSLTGGRKQSCGCLRKETFKKVAPFVARGEQHPNWKGGISGKRYAEMARKDYCDWRRNVYEKDRYTCQVCDSTNRRLEAHHLNPYHSSPDGRVDLNNGVTLCKSCHQTFHQAYSYTEFYENDFDTYKIKEAKIN